MKTRRLIALVLMSTLLAVLLLAGCGQAPAASTAPDSEKGTAQSTPASTEASTGSAAKPGAGATKAAVLLGGTREDYGFNYACANFGKQLQETLGIEVIIKENVSDTSDAEGVIEELITQGCGIVVATQFGFLDATINVAGRHPDVAFYYMGNTDKNHDNFSVINGQQWDPWYLCGVLGGFVSEGGNIGFVASMPVPDVMIAINSFQLGAQSINPDAETHVVFTGAWDDAGLATTAANQLIGSGCDTIAQFQDTPKPIIDLCEREGISVFGCNSDVMELAPDVWISSMACDWDGYMQPIKEAIDGNYECVFLQGSFSENLAKIARTGTRVTEEMNEHIGAIIEQMRADAFHVFEGPVYNQRGEVMFEEGYQPSSAEINTIDWFVKGVIGNVN